LIATKRILWALLFLAIAAPVRGAGDLVVLYPRDLTLAPEDRIRVYAFQPGGGLPTYVKMNGKVMAKLEGEALRKGEVPLDQGLNSLEVGGTTVRVYRLPGTKAERYRFPGEDGKEPLVFQAYRVHPALDEGCDGCHTVEGVKLAAKEQKGACYACHTDFGAGEEGKTKSLHAPVAAGECTGCHDPHFSTRAKLQKLEKGCLECHDAFSADGVVHKPVADGDCKACHGPHVGSGPRQLVRPGNALCLGCHDKSHTQHRAAAVKGKVTRIPDDFPRDKEELACVGCHKPHQSRERRLFPMNQGPLCRTCHPV
jgi:predicted CXXCH cytochrome family protein